VLRATLKHLNLLGRRFALAAGRGDDFEPRVFDDVDVAEAWAAPLVDTHNLWVTGNPIRPGVSGRPKMEDVESELWLLCDCDPTKDGEDPDGTSQARMDAAEESADAIYEHVGERGMLVFSGRGYQVWLRVAAGVPRRRLLQWLAYEFAVDGAKVDILADASRLMRLPGSINHRTGEQVMIVNPGWVEPITPQLVASWLGDWEEPQEFDIPIADYSPPSSLDKRRWLRGDARKVWRDEAAGGGDRSKRDFLLLLALLRAECPGEAASRLLFSMPGGKGSGDERRDFAYWRSTYESAMRHIDDTQRRNRLIETLPARAEAEGAGYVFHPKTLAAVHELRNTCPADWQVLRTQMKPIARGAGWTLSDWEERIKAAGMKDTPMPEIRYVEDVEGANANWWQRVEGDVWAVTPQSLIVSAIRAAGGSPDDALASARRCRWRTASEPFQPRELDGRRWNMSRAQYRVEPVAGPHPAWDQLLRVVGRGLDIATHDDAWCQRHGLETGGDYLRMWIASLLQHPHDLTAYLFCYSEGQRVGKSMLPEAIRGCLLSGGTIDGSLALMSEAGFSGELAGCVLAWLEETNLGRSRVASYGRMKNLVTNPDLTVHPKGGQPYLLPNTLHFFHTANDARYCPIFPGDTRITAWEALPPLESERCTKQELRKRLTAEASAFLATALALVVPDDSPRLRVPALSTSVKRWQSRASMTALQVWLESTPGWVLCSDDEIVSRFHLSLGPADNPRRWTRSNILGSLPAAGQRVRDLAMQLREMGAWEGTSQEAAATFNATSPRAVGHLLGRLKSTIDSETSNSVTMMGDSVTMLGPQVTMSLECRHSRDGTWWHFETRATR